ncbi:MAG: bacteriophage abortive infection AbiH family protein [Oscillospiraceae bacterium]|jgi:hypothetical protein|nr:bacteriophage abortive infection AbiH family protein [Oscillospiraceae bacterium]
MKNITWLVGNGFDLGLGLKTRYSDFLEWYVKPVDGDDANIRDFKNKLSDKKENRLAWSDFEKWLGEHAAAFKWEWHPWQIFLYGLLGVVFVLAIVLLVVAIISSYPDSHGFSWHLIKALPYTAIGFPVGAGTAALATTTKPKFSTGDYSKRISDAHNKLTLYLRQHVADRRPGSVDEEDFINKIANIRQHLKDNRSKTIFNKHGELGTISLPVILFNYTTAFERCVGSKFDGIINHIHGDIDRGVILGVDNAGQIANRRLRRSESTLETLLKPTIIDEKSRVRGDTAGEDARNTIRRSNIICVYGMSLGETDRTWWREIRGWLEGNPANLLIIFRYLDERERSANPDSDERRAIKQELMKFKTVSAADIRSGTGGVHKPPVGDNQVIVVPHYGLLVPKVKADKEPARR